MKVLLLGAPGAGEGARAQFITTAFDIPQISISDMLRAVIKAGTPPGLEAKKIIDESGLMHDDIIVDMVKERITQDNCKDGFLFDSFPRTLAQAEAMVEAGASLDVVVEVNIPDSVIVDRMNSHRVHLASDCTYHVTYNPPKVEDKDDVAGGDLIQHNDDKEEIVRKHLTVHHGQTEMLVDFYSKLEGEHTSKYIKIDGAQPVEAMEAEVLSALGK